MISIHSLRLPGKAFRWLSVPAVILWLPMTATAQNGGAAAPTVAPAPPSLWDLAIQGGWFMIPIALASVVTVAFTLERLFGLRRGRILPRRLIGRLRQLVNESGVDPRGLWEACDGNRSPLANVVRAAVLKTGRPHPEVESAVMDAVERETASMTRNLRPINVVASISPLLGLLGTVQGMIMAFMVTSTTGSTGTAKAQELAHGIYTALVTTFAGLCVAVVSVILANFLEGRIERLLGRMEALFLDLLPRLERYEGKVRVTEAGPGEAGGIRVRQLHTATAASRAENTAAEAGKQAARRMGAPRRIVRTAASAREQVPAAEPLSEATPVPKKKSGYETLRANFDK
ncbi:MAG: MotA/TolQ/ExbB proton channel family protein [Fuerstiella sp.]